MISLYYLKVACSLLSRMCARGFVLTHVLIWMNCSCVTFSFHLVETIRSNYITLCGISTSGTVYKAVDVAA
jgi:hypothetical protein